LCYDIRQSPPARENCLQQGKLRGLKIQPPSRRGVSQGRNYFSHIVGSSANACEKTCPENSSAACAGDSDQTRTFLRRLKNFGCTQMSEVSREQFLRAAPLFSLPRYTGPGSG
jgi:hypothetical protein